MHITNGYMYKAERELCCAKLLETAIRDTLKDKQLELQLIHLQLFLNVDESFNLYKTTGGKNMHIN